MPILTTSGRVGIATEVSGPALVTHLADCLRDVYAKKVRIEGNRVSFVGGVFRFVTNWNVLVPFGYGDLTIDSATGEVSYCLRYVQFVIYSGLIFLVVAAVLLFVGLPPTSWLILAAPLIYLASIVSNISFGVFRFRKFLRRSIATAPLLNR